MLCLSKTIFVYRFYKILVIEPTTEMNAGSIGAPSVKEIDTKECMKCYIGYMLRNLNSDSEQFFVVKIGRTFRTDTQYIFIGSYMTFSAKVYNNFKHNFFVLQIL
jgi:hypothetical protein